MIGKQSRSEKDKKDIDKKIKEINKEIEGL